MNAFKCVIHDCFAKKSCHTYHTWVHSNVSRMMKYCIQMCHVWWSTAFKCITHITHERDTFKCVTYDCKCVIYDSIQMCHIWWSTAFKCVTYDEVLHSNVSHMMKFCIQMCHIWWSTAFKCVTYDEVLHSNVSRMMKYCIQMCHVWLQMCDIRFHSNVSNMMKYCIQMCLIRYDRAIKSPDAFLDTTLPYVGQYTLLAIHCPM